MHLERLELRHFRNVEQAEIDPSPEFNVLWGENAQGKTNLLEGIYLLGHLKSFRGARNEEFVRHGATRGRIAAEVVSREVRRRMELTVAEGGKAARVDGKAARTPLEFLGHLRPVLFSPEEVGLVKGSPAGRRALVDRAIFQTDPTFLGRAQAYERCLRQRNRLLREGRGEEELAPWNAGVAREGARLRLDRLRYLRRLVPLLRETYRSIAGGGEEADLLYPVDGDDENGLRQELERELARHRRREMALGQTLAGPHRDDPVFTVNGRPLRLFGSQGQQRSFVLAFKTAQILDLEALTGEPPVLLLDDMTSELDRRRQAYFFRFLLGRRGQVFITTTDVRPLREEGIRHARFFRVSQGEFRQDQGD